MADVDDDIGYEYEPPSSYFREPDGKCMHEKGCRKVAVAIYHAEWLGRPLEIYFCAEHRDDQIRTYSDAGKKMTDLPPKPYHSIEEGELKEVASG